MRIDERKILDLPGVYSTAALDLVGKMYYAVASENRGEGAFILDSESLEHSRLWDDDESGVMNIVQIPGEERLLAITKFYPVFQSKEAEVCLLEPGEGGFLSPWNKKKVIDLPYCHRIGVFENGNGKFVVCCSLCQDKDFQEDWSKPGAVYIARIGSWKLWKVHEGLTKNHGLCIDGTDIYVASEDGVLRFDASTYAEGDLIRAERISGTPTSDISVSEKYFATIEPFHGNASALYDRKYSKIRTRRMDFGHVVWTGTINGRSYVILGSRAGEKELVLIDAETGEETVIDKNVGPTQVTVAYKDGYSIILAANHAAGTVCTYHIG